MLNNNISAGIHTRVWITKYAMSGGIFQISAKLCGDDQSFVAFKIDPKGLVSYVHAPHWHLTLESALKKARAMKLAKIKSLEKSIDKLKKTEFSAAKVKVY